MTCNSGLYYVQLLTLTCFQLLISDLNRSYLWKIVAWYVYLMLGRQVLAASFFFFSNTKIGAL